MGANDVDIGVKISTDSSTLTALADALQQVYKAAEEAAQKATAAAQASVAPIEAATAEVRQANETYQKALDLQTELDEKRKAGTATQAEYAAASQAVSNAIERAFAAEQALVGLQVEKKKAHEDELAAAKAILEQKNAAKAAISAEMEASRALAAEQKGQIEEKRAAEKSASDELKAQKAAESQALMDNAARMHILTQAVHGLREAYGIAVDAAQKFVGAIKGVVGASMENELAVTKLNAMLAASGDTSGVTSRAYQQMALEMQKVTRFSDEQVLAGVDMLTMYKNIGKDIVPEATKALADMAEMSGSVSSAAYQLGRALEEPDKASASLYRTKIKLTEAEDALLKKMVAANDVLGAQRALLGMVEDRVGGLANAMGSTLDGMIKRIANSFDEMKETVGGALLPELERVGAAVLVLFDSNAVRNSINKLAQSITMTLGPVIEKFVGWIEKDGAGAIEELGKKIDTAFKWISDNKEAIGTGIKNIGDMFGDLLSKLKDLSDWASKNPDIVKLLLGMAVVSKTPLVGSAVEGAVGGLAGAGAKALIGGAGGAAVLGTAALPIALIAAAAVAAMLMINSTDPNVIAKMGTTPWSSAETDPFGVKAWERAQMAAPKPISSHEAWTATQYTAKVVSGEGDIYGSQKAFQAAKQSYEALIKPIEEFGANWILVDDAVREAGNGLTKAAASAKAASETTTANILTTWDERGKLAQKQVQGEMDYYALLLQFKGQIQAAIDASDPTKIAKGAANARDVYMQGIYGGQQLEKGWQLDFAAQLKDITAGPKGPKAPDTFMDLMKKDQAKVELLTTRIADAVEYLKLHPGDIQAQGILKDARAELQKIKTGVDKLGGANYAESLSKAFATPEAAMAWEGAFAGEHGGQKPGATDIRDMMAGRAYAASKGLKEIPLSDWQERYYKGAFPGEDKTGLDALFGPGGTLATLLQKQVDEDVKRHDALITAFDKQAGLTGTGNAISGEIRDILRPPKAAGTPPPPEGEYEGAFVHKATGGLVNYPTLAYLAENGPELVVPLNPQDRTKGNVGVNYNLNVYSQAKTENVVADFALLQAMANVMR